MKQFRLLILSISIFTGLYAQQITSLAILDFEGRGVADYEAATLTDWLRSEIVRLEAVRVVERGDMLGRLMEEQDLSLTGCISDECAVQVGKVLGVTHMMAGSIGLIGSKYVIIARIIDVETGQDVVSATRRAQGPLDNLLDVMIPLASELLGLDQPAQPAKSREIRPEYGTLSVSTVPYQTQIILKRGGTTLADGRSRNRWSQLRPGRYDLLLSSSGYQDWKRSIEVKAGMTTLVRVSLKKAFESIRTSPRFKKPETKRDLNLTGNILVQVIGWGGIALNAALFKNGYPGEAVFAMFGVWMIGAYFIKDNEKFEKTIPIKENIEYNQRGKRSLEEKNNAIKKSNQAASAYNRNLPAPKIEITAD